MSVNLLVCWFVGLLVCWFVCRSVHLLIYLLFICLIFVCLSARSFVYWMFVHFCGSFFVFVHSFVCCFLNFMFVCFLFF